MALQLSVLAILVSAFLCLVQAQPQQGSCQPGQIEIENSNGPNGPVRECERNPCFGGNNPCLGGGRCTPIRITTVGNEISLAFKYTTSCSCNAPYAATTVAIPIGNTPYSFTRGFCVIPDADPCTPNPCFSPGICSPLTDGSSRPGFVCSCPGRNFFGLINILRCSIDQLSSLTGSQGVCGSGAAADFPFRCYFNNDPQGRYVCCELGCNGFEDDKLTPRCSNNGYIPPGFGVSGLPPNPPPSPPPSGPQGVCGTGSATDFPTRCYFNNDPQGRYVCCDRQGCNGFNPDNLTPGCANNGFVPQGFGVSGSPVNPPPPTPPSGPQGVCGTGGAADFPTRCYFNNDPQGRYVCCDKDGCDGFNPPDNLFPRCKTNGYVPPGFGV